MAARDRIAEILVKAEVIDDLQLRSASSQQAQWGGRIAKIVVEMRFAKEDAVTKAIGDALGMQAVQLGTVQKDPAALSKVELSFAEEKGIFPVQLKDNGRTLVLAMANPTDLETIDAVGRKVRARVQPVLSGEGDIRRAILRHYRNVEPELLGGPSAQAPRAAEPPPDEEEFKITDLSGKTVMRSLESVHPGLAAEVEAEKAAVVAAPRITAAVESKAGSGKGIAEAAAILDEMLGPSPAGGLSAEEQKRLESLRANQHKSAVILKALAELLVEKGVSSAEELAERGLS
ncbi:MAG: general secretion pathway protein GspE [Myxococcales bacterium]|nr:general secretion pathway protein GspE [Myxococcales bacterium]